tara:strand:- start:1745 stop:2284 length:540 start_codon:yes stop_codon:yes gene_type:complete
MARINFDTAKRLDIACKRGDSFELELTLKDSSGIPINLGGGSLSSFEMLITQPLGGGSQVVAGSNQEGVLAATEGMDAVVSTSRIILVTLEDDSLSTTADPAAAAYIEGTAASGKVKFSMSKSDMFVTGQTPYQIVGNYVYDIKYINPNVLIDGESEGRTILFGNFVLKGDFSRFSESA